MLQDLAAASNSIIFSPQWLNIPLILQESADATGTLPCDPLPPPLLLHAPDICLLYGIEPILLQWESDITNTMLMTIDESQIWMLISFHYHSPGLTLDIFPFPVTAQDIFLCPTTPQDLPESIYMIPTVGSSPSFFLCSLAVWFLPWPDTHFNCLWFNKKTSQTRPCYQYPK